MIDSLAPTPPLSIGQCATLACLLEVTAPKVGNVHRAADFSDLHFADFLASAAAIGPVFDRAQSQPIGNTIYEAVVATRALVSTNTNLGIVLLLAPLASVPSHKALSGVGKMLQGLTRDDANQVYKAIRVAQPGGMGDVEEYDIRGTPPANLLEAMELARDRDLIAKQFVTAFADVFAAIEYLLRPAVENGSGLLDAIVWSHAALLARFGDSLLGRRRGTVEDEKARVMARQAVDAGPPILLDAFKVFAGEANEQTEPRTALVHDRIVWDGGFWGRITELDFWMRSAPGRNPGTTADLVTAMLFCALRDGHIRPPFRWLTSTE